jgi:hypothetical protein
MRRWQRTLTALACALYVAALTLDATGGRLGGDITFAVGTVLWAIASTIAVREGRDRKAAARQRDRDFYAARRAGASGPEAWISSGRAAAERPASRRGSG